MSAWDELDELIDNETGEISVKIEVMTECAWSGELRYTPSPNRSTGPDRSIVFYSAGGAAPKDVVRALLADLRDWRANPTLGPFPRWDRPDSVDG